MTTSRCCCSGLRLSKKSGATTFLSPHTTAHIVRTQGKHNRFVLFPHTQLANRRLRIIMMHSLLFCVSASLLLSLVSSVNWNDRWQVKADDGKSKSLCHHKLPYPNEYLSKTSYSNKALVAMTKTERKSKKCSFVGAQCFMEADEHELVFKYIHPNDTVLEVSPYTQIEPSY